MYNKRPIINRQFIQLKKHLHSHSSAAGDDKNVQDDKIVEFKGVRKLRKLSKAKNCIKFQGQLKLTATGVFNFGCNDCLRYCDACTVYYCFFLYCSVLYSFRSVYFCEFQNND